ncbi:sensor domain-containing phosphodiesterase [Marinobacter bohaiensis]|uniref:sensor domain-containing phosphodiesterase n=1 Tax=Marinobacter bohaiensis TaxID=2201898 RepID=UPI000DACDC8E|nr:EAL domain-containing protein [Marinobacter bohaiensis]
MSYVASLKATFNRTTRQPLRDYDYTSVFQPIFSPTHQRLVGYEALMRANRDGEAIAPLEVFQQAEALHQTECLDRRLQSLHIRTFTQHQPDTWLFLNISPANCVQPEKALAHLEQACLDHDLHPAQVVLELVETATDNKAQLLDFVQRARAWGFQIAVDDFGIGDSNFERVWQLEPLIIKIDRSLLVNAEVHLRARQLLNGLVSLIRESGSLVLIEGIETPDQARIALATGADLLQGFLFGYPAPLDKPRTAPELDFAEHLAVVQRHNRQADYQHSGYLDSLRLEVLEACQRIAGHDTLADACMGLLKRRGIKRCFILDADGIQQGGLASETRVRHTTRFNPLYQSSGACWSHREYFRRALEQPGKINVSRPYVALPDAVRTITLSASITRHGTTQVFCVDLHPNELFDGQLDFPDSL